MFTHFHTTANDHVQSKPNYLIIQHVLLKHKVINSTELI